MLTDGYNEYDVLSASYHEMGHGPDIDGFMPDFNFDVHHLDIYQRQISQPYFSKTTPTFQKDTYGLMDDIMDGLVQP